MIGARPSSVVTEPVSVVKKALSITTSPGVTRSPP